MADNANNRPTTTTAHQQQGKRQRQGGLLQEELSDVDPNARNIQRTNPPTLLTLPFEILALICVQCGGASVGNLLKTCKYLHNVLMDPSNDLPIWRSLVLVDFGWGSGSVDTTTFQKSDACPLWADVYAAHVDLWKGKWRVFATAEREDNGMENEWWNRGNLCDLRLSKFKRVVGYPGYPNPNRLGEDALKREMDESYADGWDYSGKFWDWDVKELPVVFGASSEEVDIGGETMDTVEEDAGVEVLLEDDSETDWDDSEDEYIEGEHDLEDGEVLLLKIDSANSVVPAEQLSDAESANNPTLFLKHFAAVSSTINRRGLIGMAMEFRGIEDFFDLITHTGHPMGPLINDTRPCGGPPAATRIFLLGTNGSQIQEITVPDVAADLRRHFPVFGDQPIGPVLIRTDGNAIAFFFCILLPDPPEDECCDWWHGVFMYTLCRSTCTLQLSATHDLSAVFNVARCTELVGNTVVHASTFETLRKGPRCCDTSTWSSENGGILYGASLHGRLALIMFSGWKTDDEEAPPGRDVPFEEFQIVLLALDVGSGAVLWAAPFSIKGTVWGLKTMNLMGPSPDGSTLVVGKLGASVVLDCIGDRHGTWVSPKNSNGKVVVDGAMEGAEEAQLMADCHGVLWVERKKVMVETGNGKKEEAVATVFNVSPFRGATGWAP
ncbi:hypothetical protein HK104_004125 [Borealophlyctis nickersoniae]|nr:hypothetical protein HK104_004125 [Borealophlyctis nickersoniae]